MLISSSPLFSSPVRWIETQDLLFDYYEFERMVEVGPSPTLTGMASRTLALKYAQQDVSVSRKREILAHSKNQKEVYYQFEDAAPEEAAAPEPSSSSPSSSTPAPAAAASAPAPVAPAPSSGPVAEIPDAPLKAVDTLRIIIAQKLKKKVEEVPLSKTVKDLVGGKSTLQNEILSDLQLEFGSAPEKGEELPLDELGSALGFGYSGTIGKCTSALISRMIGGKMPGGFNISAAKAHIAKTWGLGPSRTDAAILLGITMEPPKRLGSEAEAKAWLDSVVAAYAQGAGISLSSGGGGAGGGGGGGGGPVINSEEFIKFQKEQEEFANQHLDLYHRYLKTDPRAGHRLADEEKANSAILQARLDAIDREHGDAYVQGIQPVFEPLKARHFDSSWNWVRQDALIMFYDIIFGRLTTVDRGSSLLSLFFPLSDFEPVLQRSLFVRLSRFVFAEITSRCIAIMNRADPTLIEYMQYHVDQCLPEQGENFKLVRRSLSSSPSALETSADHFAVFVFRPRSSDSSSSTTAERLFTRDLFTRMVSHLRFTLFFPKEIRADVFRFQYSLQSPSPPLLIPRSPQRETSSTPRSFERTFESSRPTSRRWLPAPRSRPTRTSTCSSSSLFF
jgi:fatty acid synthase subunit alpha